MVMDQMADIKMAVGTEFEMGSPEKAEMKRVLEKIREVENDLVLKKGEDNRPLIDRTLELLAQVPVWEKGKLEAVGKDENGEELWRGSWERTDNNKDEQGRIVMTNMLNIHQLDEDGKIGLEVGIFLAEVGGKVAVLNLGLSEVISNTRSEVVYGLEKPLETTTTS
jgi:hypothetical protein